jgi:hypothetical protein
MAKIENVTVKPARSRRFEVLVSFDGLDKGLVFTQEADDTAWADRHVATGYLRDLDEEESDVRGAEGTG